MKQKRLKFTWRWSLWPLISRGVFGAHGWTPTMWWLDIGPLRVTWFYANPHRL